MRSSSIPPPEVTDLWAIAPDQKAYYLSQFLRLQPDPSGHLSGLQAKAFFELSKLPTHDLSSIWELSDVDCDGKLSLSEFCVAMHLVVLRRNNVLLPKHLPQTLRREATSNALSAVNLPRRSSPDPPAPPSPPGRQVNATCSVTDGPASVLDSPRTVPRLVLSEHHSLDSAPPADPCPRCPDTDSLAVRQRRWSASSQSDVVSLTENAVPSFDGRLAPNAQLHHPIPIRAGAPLASFQSPPPIRHFNTTRPLDLPGRPLAGVPSDSAVLVNAIPDHPAPPPPPPSAPQPRPPTPPPRARTIGATGRPVLGPPRNSSGPSLPNPLTDDLPPSQLPADAVSLRNQQLSALIGTLQAECDQVLASNNELTLELVLLQQRRIALEILLERLTPLEA